METSTAVNSRWKAADLAYIALGAVLMTVCAWISIPTTVPFTMQTFAVFAVLGLLGGRRGTWSVVVYLLMGAVGLPVFSGFSGGLGWMLGATGGYLIGFLGSALVYWLATHALGGGTPAMAFGMILGLAVCYTFGTAWFFVVYARTSGAIGIDTALGWCVIPFLVPDLTKLALALGVTKMLGKYTHLS